MFCHYSADTPLINNAFNQGEFHISLQLNILNSVFERSSKLVMKITMDSFKPHVDEKNKSNFLDVESPSLSGIIDFNNVSGVTQIPVPIMSSASRSDSNSSSTSSDSASSNASSTAEKLLCLDCHSCLCTNCMKKVMDLEERNSSCNALYCVSAFR